MKSFVAQGKWAAILAVTTASCSSGKEEAVWPSDQASERLEWMEGVDQSQVAYDDHDQLTRCWQQGSGYDCVTVFANDGATANPLAQPLVHYLLRFQTGELPSRRRALEDLSVADGYQCEIQRQGHAKLLKETIWKDRRPVEQHMSGPTPDRVPWTLEEIARLTAKHGLRPQDAYFLCSLVDEVVERQGLLAVDSPLITYGTIFLNQARFAKPDPVITRKARR
ncbi:hypothetical protein [Novosphingobium album (ex Liu et al. 2023)]|uniref:Uncharacterized protein n=1 Tax=Novosphingobium album (ex Liu et al. 2023) TaxID=3031130 RepID=A0ABT5WLM7_9SPHN|nr:hypothetical protein [Novosphingobium album (ex Liu et al. 2023)]MDE8650944.1 hypothetical protein [Novosphingobium album (ex Liu et al. 2023)]